MKLSCTPISFSASFRDGTMDLPRFLDLCAEQQLDAVDLMAPDSYPWAWSDGAWSDGPASLQDALRLVERAGLSIAAYATGNAFTKQDDVAFREQVLLVKRAIAEAAELGVPVLRLFGGYIEATGGEPGMTTAHGLEKVIAGLEAVLPTAVEHRVKLALENHGRLPGHSHEMLAIARRFDSPWLGFTVDCGNFMGNSMDEFEDPVAAVERLATHTFHVHLKDVRPPVVNLERRMEGCITGQGDIPIRQCVAALAQRGYTGYYSLEYEAHTVSPAHEGVPASLAYLREVRDIMRVLYADLAEEQPAP